MFFCLFHIATLVPSEPTSQTGDSQRIHFSVDFNCDISNIRNLERYTIAQGADTATPLDQVNPNIDKWQITFSPGPVLPRGGGRYSCPIEIILYDPSG